MPKNQQKKRHVVDLIVVVKNCSRSMEHGFYGCMHGFSRILFMNKNERFESSNRSFYLYPKIINTLIIIKLSH
jgi:hypothetical protein